ncbi:MAG: glycosyltransferase family 39 protein, partial [Candidatus Colwellbacteria bacterium]|nr:glycosyltransferase family 39 protein [Candidatus Colwellbacteria bacterium]
MRILPALSSPKGLLLLIVIIAAFLRLWSLPTVPPGLYPDEAMNGNNALEALETAPPAGGWKVFYPENNGREGLFINIQSVSLALFGNEPWALRLPSTIFGILTVLGLYFLTKELFRNSKLENRNSDVALLAAFLLATSFWHINFSRIGFRAIMAPMFLTWGIYFLLLALNRITTAVSKLNHSKLIRNSKFEIRNLLLLPALAGAVYGLGMHSYIAYRATPLLILFIFLAYLLKNKEGALRKKILVSGLWFLVASFIVFLPLGLYFFNNPADFFGRTTQISVFSSETPLKDLSLNIVKTLGMFNFAGDYNWRH